MCSVSALLLSLSVSYFQNMNERYDSHPRLPVHWRSALLSHMSSETLRIMFTSKPLATVFNYRPSDGVNPGTFNTVAPP